MQCKNTHEKAKNTENRKEGRRKKFKLSYFIEWKKKLSKISIYEKKTYIYSECLWITFCLFRSLKRKNVRNIPEGAPQQQNRKGGILVKKYYAFLFIAIFNHFWHFITIIILIVIHWRKYKTSKKMPDG